MNPKVSNATKNKTVQKATSIHTIAAHAGVSSATVSRVINHRPGVIAATVNVVRQAMSELGYEPLPAHKRRGPRLEQARKRNKLRVAVVVVGIDEPALQSPVYTDLLYSIENALRAQNLALILQRVADLDQLRPTALRREVDGAILFGRVDEILPTSPLGDLPCVRVMSTCSVQPWYDHVTYNNRQIGTLAAQYLLDQGHHHCAFVGEAGELHSERSATFHATMERAGGTVTLLTGDGLVESTPQIHRVRRDRLQPLVEKLQSLQPRPTGLFVAADILTVALYPLLTERGIQPSRDLTVVSCNNEARLIAALRPPPVEIDIHASAIGRRGVEQLLWRLEHRNELPSRTLIDPAIVQPDAHNLEKV